MVHHSKRRNSKEGFADNCATSVMTKTRGLARLEAESATGFQFKASWLG